MDLLIILPHFLVSLVFTSFSFLPSLIIVGYNALWNILIDRMIIGILIAILMRPIGMKIFGQVDLSRISAVNEFIKVPISVFLGGYLLKLFMHDSGVIYAFAIGYVLWFIPVYMGFFKHYPNKNTMLFGNILGASIATLLLKGIIG